MVTWPHSVDDIGGFLITWLPIIFFGIIIWLLLRTMALVPKVKPAMVDRDTTDPVGWDDVAGADEAKEELKEVVEFLRDRKKFERLGARVPKGVLLYGPPGTGQDAAREGRRERVGRKLLLVERLGLRRDVRRRSVRPGSASSSKRRARTRRRSSSSTSSTPSGPPARAARTTASTTRP